MWLVILAAACGGGASDVSPLLPFPDSTEDAWLAPPAAPSVQAWSGNVGGLVVVGGFPPAVRSAMVIEAQRDGAWSTVCEATFRCYLSSPADAVRVSHPPSSWSSGEVSPTAVEVALTSDRTDAAWWADEGPQLSVATDGRPAEARVFLSRPAPLRPQWFDASAGRFGFRPVALTTESLSLPVSGDLSGTLSWTAHVAIQGGRWTLEEGTVGGALLELSTSSLEGAALGRTWAWGDLHAHSDLSHDGCEDPASGCTNDITTVGLDFFDDAIAEGLDFAAMSDHAEWRTWAESAEATETLNIWDRQQDAVASALAADPDFVPLLGFEWTSGDTHADTDGHWPGGHRTVFFEDTEVCESARVSAVFRSEDTMHEKAEHGAVLYGGNPVNARTQLDLIDDLAAAVDSCGLTGRIQLVPHHPAFSPPAPFDWTNPDNVVDPEYTTVVEMYSEHGSSECEDNTTEPCDWRMKEGSDYKSFGALQSALQLGIRLGIVGGTDSHDGMPGTVENDPSCTAIWDEDLGALRCHQWRGGLTGVMVSGGFSRTTLFDALVDRTTLASSGPRLPVRAWIETLDGRVVLPGEAVSAPMAERLTVSVEGLIDPDEWEQVFIEVISADGIVVASTEEATLQVDLRERAGDALYTRLRLYAPAVEPGGDEGERMWLSPWFFE